MRTRIDIEDDLLASARELARSQGVSTGKVVSALIREALLGRRSQDGASVQLENAAATGFQPFPSRGVQVTNELINRLRDQDGI